MAHPQLNSQKEVPGFSHDLFVRFKALLSLSVKYSALGNANTISYAPALLILVAILLGSRRLTEISVHTILSSLTSWWAYLKDLHIVSLWGLTKLRTVVLCLWCTLAVFGALRWYTSRRKSVYLLDFFCFVPDPSMKCNFEVSEYITRRSNMFSLPSMEFQRKVFLRSGLGGETYVPAFIFQDRRISSHADALSEAELQVYGSVDLLLKKTGVRPWDISILISNCSLFTPVPSHSAMLVNRFKMRENVKTFELSGMGCSASVIACKLAKDMLETCPNNHYALVVSYENITRNWYFGDNKSMLVTNCLFRSGCAAILLTNNPKERSRSKYRFSHCVRTHKAADDKAYRCAFQSEDDKGTLAVALNKNLMGVAADALRTNIVALGPLILPFSELLLFVFSRLCSKVLKLKVQPYLPDFKLAVEHFCFHAGGRAVIDEIQKSMRLKDSSMEPSRATLHRFGNTSASCLWYVMSYMEAKQRIRKGDRIWMLGLGSGFKCNSAILTALNDVTPDLCNPWLGSIHRYPGAQNGSLRRT